MKRPALVAAALAGTFCFAKPAAAEGLAYVRDLAAAQATAQVVIDARPLPECRAASLPGALCLPAGELLGPHNRLPSFRDVLWLLGTAGLTGAERVLVVGEAAAARDFVAGMLHLAGQRHVDVLTEPLSRGGAATAPGAERGMVREAVYTAPMRDDLLVLKHELAAMPAPVLLDGRGDGEFWGATARAVRGGHIPGADSLPATELRADLARGEALLPRGARPVAYGHDALDGLAYFTLLRAGAGADARVYAAGWAEWAADSALPADAATYPAVRVAAPDTPAAAPAPRAGQYPLLAGVAAAGALFGAGLAILFLWRKRAWT